MNENKQLDLQGFSGNKVEVIRSFGKTFVRKTAKNMSYNIKMKHAPIIRTPMGGYRGYGPTHSQTLEKLFFGVPGLLVISNDQIHNQHYIH